MNLLRFQCSSPLGSSGTIKQPCKREKSISELQLKGLAITHTHTLTRTNNMDKFAQTNKTTDTGEEGRGFSALHCCTHSLMNTTVKPQHALLIKVSCKDYRDQPLTPQTETHTLQPVAYLTLPKRLSQEESVGQREPGGGEVLMQANEQQKGLER